MIKKMTQMPPITVTALTNVIKSMLESSLDHVVVIGEISDLNHKALVSGGHCYLTLKDEQAGQKAQLPAVIWQSVVQKLRFELQNGQEVIATGRIGVYAPHGKYQLTITKLEPVGVGALELAFRQLQDKLARQGLFDPARKRILPRPPKRIALITARTGAAIRDFLNILKQRCERPDITLVPVSVQGSEAASEMINAIKMVNRLNLQTTDPPFDLIVLIRGGGSIEDLWAFNNEQLVYAICQSTIPVATGIGHEIDTTLSDLAADLHALTPSDAATRIVGDDQQYRRQLPILQQRLVQSLRHQWKQTNDRLNLLRQRACFTIPEEKVLQSSEERLRTLQTQCERTIDSLLHHQQSRMIQQVARMEALSPLTVLARGYSLTTDIEGKLIVDSTQTLPGQKIVTRLASGKILSQIETIIPEKDTQKTSNSDPEKTESK